MGVLEDFIAAVNSHDVTFEYSDDPQCWRRGHDQKEAIKRLASQLKIEDVRRIWNAKMDRTLRPDEAARWYWKG